MRDFHFYKKLAKRLLVTLPVGLAGLSVPVAHAQEAPASVNNLSVTGSVQSGSSIQNWAFRKDVWNGPYPNLFDCRLMERRYVFMFSLKKSCEKHADGQWWFLTH